MRLETLFQSSSRGTFLDGDPMAAEAVPQGAVAVLGAAGATPYKSVGPYCASAPGAIRAASARYAVNRTHYDFDASAFAANRARIESHVATILARGAKPLLLGGDDSVQIPALKAHATHGDVTVLQIDAHIDWREEVQGERLGLSSTMRRASEMAGVKSIVQVGARGIGSARASDVADAKAAGAQLVDMRQVRAHGAAHAAEFVSPDRPVVVCLDVDALDPSVVPGVIGRAPGGFGYGDVVELLHAVAARAPIIGFNIVEFVPENDAGELGAIAVCRLAMFGAGLLAAA
jgi:agmatinase